MNCVIEKKKAEEIVDQKAKPLPPILGLTLNITSDPRYLHFTGEKMSISCHDKDNNNEEGKVPLGRGPLLPLPLRDMLAQAFEGSSSPVQVIGPIPLLPQNIPRERSQPRMMRLFEQNLVPIQHHEEEPEPQESHNNLGALGALGLPPHLVHLLPQIEDGPSGERALHHPLPVIPRTQHHIQHCKFS